jgi:outer membrane protein TolC
MPFTTLARRAAAPGLAFALVWATFAAAYAADAPLTLEAAVQRGLAQAPLLTARDAGLDAAHEEAARAGRLPDPALTVGLANYPVTAPGAFSLRSDPMTMRTVGIRQAIPSRAARQAEHDLAAARIDVAAADRVATTQSVSERIADAWIDVWAAERQRHLLGDLRYEATVAVQTAQARLRGGEGSATEALAARGDLAALDNRLDAAEAALDVAQAGLRRWLGDAGEPLADPPDFGLLPVAPQRLQQAIDRQAPMQAWTAREQAAEAALHQARAARHPDWSLGATYGSRAPGLSDMLMLEVGVSLPLFTRNRQDRGISARQAERDAVEAEREDARRAQREAVAQAVATWQGWNRQIDRYCDTLLPLARDRSATALALYRGGGALQPWLEARRDEIRQRLDYADALAARARLWASLAYLLPNPEEAP